MPSNKTTTEHQIKCENCKYPKTEARCLRVMVSSGDSDCIATRPEGLEKDPSGSAAKLITSHTGSNKKPDNTPFRRWVDPHSEEKGGLETGIEKILTPCDDVEQGGDNYRARDEERPIEQSADAVLRCRLSLSIPTRRIKTYAKEDHHRRQVNNQKSTSIHGTSSGRQFQPTPQRLRTHSDIIVLIPPHKTTNNATNCGPNLKNATHEHRKRRHQHASNYASGPQQNRITKSDEAKRFANFYPHSCNTRPRWCNSDVPRGLLLLPPNTKQRLPYRPSTVRWGKTSPHLFLCTADNQKHGLCMS